MVVPSLISNTLLLEEAAAEQEESSHFFSKGILRVDVDKIGIKSDSFKLTAGFDTLST